MELNKDSYFSREADLEYISVSQYKLFRECNAKAMSLLNSETSAEEKTAYLERTFI